MFAMRYQANVEVADAMVWTSTPSWVKDGPSAVQSGGRPTSRNNGPQRGSWCRERSSGSSFR